MQVLWNIIGIAAVVAVFSMALPRLCFVVFKWSTIGYYAGYDTYHEVKKNEN